jgi:hypothetical protein
MARVFDRPSPGNRYSAAERKAWGAAQDAARAARAAQVAQGITAPKPKRASRAKTLVADTSDSTCFDSLVYRNGVVTASFIGPAAGVWDYDVDLATAREWFADPSLGGYFNDQIK